MEIENLQRRILRCLKEVRKLGQHDSNYTIQGQEATDLEVKHYLDKPLSKLLREGVQWLSEKQRILVGEKCIFSKEIDYPNSRIRLRITSRIEYNNRLNPKKKEPWTVEWIEHFVKPKDVMYDIGANVGAYSLIASKATKGEAKIFSFEPGFTTFPKLCYNIILNNCEQSIVPLSIPLSDKTGVSEFNYSDLAPGKAFHQVGTWKATDKYTTPVYSQLMISYSIDDVIKNLALPVPNHIKIDVDGTEMAILRGASETLNSTHLRSLMVEADKGEANTVIKFVKEHGFHLLSKYNEEDGCRRPYYLLFCRMS